MADLRLDDSLSMEEWQRRRNEGLLSGWPDPNRPTRVRWEGDRARPAPAGPR